MTAGSQLTTSQATPQTSGAKAALRLNAALSLATGLLLTAMPGTVGRWLDVSIDGWLRALGLGLLGHFAMLVWATNRRDIQPWLKLNLVVIAPYPLLMIGLVVGGLIDRPLGQALVLADGAAVGTLAAMQWKGLRASEPSLQTQRV